MTAAAKESMIGKQVRDMMTQHGHVAEMIAEVTQGKTEVLGSPGVVDTLLSQLLADKKGEEFAKAMAEAKSSVAQKLGEAKSELGLVWDARTTTPEEASKILSKAIELVSKDRSMGPENRAVVEKLINALKTQHSESMDA